jgi:hypothetical protein
MKCIYLIGIFLLFFNSGIASQVGINHSSSPPNSSAMLDVNSTSKGFLVPRMTKTNRNAIANPANSLLIYQTNDNPGFYFNAGTPASPQWLNLANTSIVGAYKTPIDTLPFTINTSGSFIMTKPLYGNNGITINADNVSIDLNYFTLKGNPGNASHGINVVSPYKNINIYNGNLTNWGGDGIRANTASDIRVQNITVQGNAGDGLNLGTKSTVLNSIATQNGYDGFAIGSSSVIEHCIAYLNGSSGISANENTSISNCSSSSNSINGFITLNNCTLHNNTSYKNSATGFYLGLGNKAFNNSSDDNITNGYVFGTGSYGQGNSARGNNSHGFHCNNDVCLIQNNADSNGGSGFFSASNGGKLDSNNSTDNLNGYLITGIDWLVIKNSASGNASSPFNVAASNMIGTVITSANINSNTNPNANTSY